MYDTHHTCTYNLAECSEQDYVYQKDMLAVLGLKEFNEEEINRRVDELYTNIKESAEMQECMTKAAGIMLSEDEHIGFMVLFSFDYLYLLHDCLRKYNNDKDGYKSSVDRLKTKLNV